MREYSPLDGDQGEAEEKALRLPAARSLYWQLALLQDGQAGRKLRMHPRRFYCRKMTPSCDLSCLPAGLTRPDGLFGWHSTIIERA